MGFVTSLGTDGVELKTADQGQTIKLPMERVSALMMSNRPQLPKPGQHMVWLEDGSRILAKDLTMGDQNLKIQPLLSDVTASIPLKWVRRIDLSTPAGVLRSLTGLSMMSTGGVVFGVAMPPQIAGSQIHIHAPVTLGFDLPTGTARFWARVELDTRDQAAQVRRWADMNLVIRIDAKEVGQFHIDAAQPAVEINLPVTGRRMSLEAAPGINGPVMDRLTIEDAVLLVRFGSLTP